MDKALASIMDWWADVGVDVPDITTAHAKARPTKQRALTAQSKSSPSATAAPKPDAPAPILDAAPMAAKAKTLQDLKSAMDSFEAGPLSDHARQCVFARGNPKSGLMLIGEAPGREEDRAGKPFIGPAGQLLDKMLASIGLSEDEFYMTNIVNWRPPKKRNPTAGEIEMCRPFLNRHIELAAPKVIVLVGGVSLSAMTGESGIVKKRGQWQVLDINGKSYPALPIYHPAFLLRQPLLKKDAWRDLLTLREKLGALSKG